MLISSMSNGNLSFRLTAGCAGCLGSLFVGDLLTGWRHQRRGPLSDSDRQGPLLHRPDGRLAPPARLACAVGYWRAAVPIQMIRKPGAIAANRRTPARENRAQTRYCASSAISTVAFLALASRAAEWPFCD